MLIIVAGLCFFYYLIILPVHQYKLETTLVPFTKWQFVFFVLSVVLVAAAGNIINDYFDFELDREFKPQRPLPAGIISLDAAMYLHMAFAVAGIGLGFYLGWVTGNFKTGYLYVICAVFLYLYSAYLKRIPLVGNIVISALTAFVFILLMLFEVNFLNAMDFESATFAYDVLMVQIKFYAMFAFLTSLAREIVKDLEDSEGDAAYNINTMAVQFGITTAKVTGILVLIVTCGLLGIFLTGFWQSGATKEFLYLLITVMLPLFGLMVLLIRARTSRQFAIAGNVLKAIMVFGIFSIPVFYMFNK